MPAAEEKGLSGRNSTVHSLFLFLKFQFLTSKIQLLFTKSLYIEDGNEKNQLVMVAVVTEVTWWCMSLTWWSMGMTWWSM